MLPNLEEIPVLVLFFWPSNTMMVICMDNAKNAVVLFSKM